MTGSVPDAFAILWQAFRSVDDPRERRVLLDAVRDALDRSADTLDDTIPPGEAERFVAGTLALEAVVGHGGSAVVHRARHRDLGTLHAVKRLKPELAGDPTLRRLFLDEARHHLAVRHPAIVEAEACLRSPDGTPALLMRYVEGPALSQGRARPAFGIGDVVRLGRRLAEGLHAVHAAGFVHLDVSPGNVILEGGEPGRAVLCDFGLSRPEGSPRYDAGVARAATRRFAPPEQLAGDRPLDRRADVFALGALLAWLSPSDDRLEPLIRSMTAPDPRKRPLDMKNVDALLEAIGSDRERRAPVRSVVDAASQRPRNRTDVPELAGLDAFSARHS